MPLLQRLRNRPLLPLCSVLLALLGLVGAALYGYFSQSNQERQLSHYGQALASSAARQAVNATLNQDMISLQVMLRELTQHPAVVGATIHDVENRLLVQSGYSPSKLEEREHLSFTAPVALHNNIAGYLRVAIEPPGLSAADRHFFWAWSLCVLLAAVLPWLPDLIGKRASTPGTGEQAELAEESGPEGDAITLRLSLELLNLERLYRQLNLESFIQLVERLEYQLGGVLALYGGRRRLLSEHRLLVDFEGRDSRDCAFRALCSAQLLTRLTAHNPGPKLHLGARIHVLPEPGSASLAQEFMAQQGDGANSQQAGIYIAPELVDEDLQQHLELAPDTGRLVSIKPPYKALLEKQQEQLLRVTNRSQ